MRKILSVLLAFVMLFSLSITAFATEKVTEFSDVSKDAWYYEAVTAVAEAGLVNGVGDGKFSPETPLTKLQFITILIRYMFGDEMEEYQSDLEEYLGMDEIGYIEDAYNILNKPDVTYADMKHISEEEFEMAVAELKEMDADEIEELTQEVSMYYMMVNNLLHSWFGLPIFIAEEEGLFDYLELDDEEFYELMSGNDSYCTREEMAACIEWLLDYTEDCDDMGLNAYYEMPDDYIPDVEESPYLYSIQYVYSMGILQGVDENRTFNPYGILTRGQACQVIYRIIKPEIRKVIDVNDIYKFEINKSLEEVPESIRGIFNKTGEELGIDFDADFDSLKSVSDLDGFCIVEKDYGLDYVYYEDGKFVTYNPVYDDEYSIGVKVVAENIIARDTVPSPDYYLYAIADGKVYFQYIVNPVEYDNGRTVNGEIESREIVSKSVVDELKGRIYEIGDIRGSWVNDNYYAYDDSIDTILDIKGDTITIGEKSYSIKSLGENIYEISDGKVSGRYRMWIAPNYQLGYGDYQSLSISFLDKDIDKEVLNIFFIEQEEYIDETYVRCFYPREVAEMLFRYETGDVSPGAGSFGSDLIG